MLEDVTTITTNDAIVFSAFPVRIERWTTNDAIVFSAFPVRIERWRQ